MTKTKRGARALLRDFGSSLKAYPMPYVCLMASILVTFVGRIFWGDTAVAIGILILCLALAWGWLAGFHDLSDQSS